MSTETLRRTAYSDVWLPKVPGWEICYTSLSAIPQTSDPAPKTQDPSGTQNSDPRPDKKRDLSAAASKQGLDSFKKRKRSARKCNRAVAARTSTRPSVKPWVLRVLLRVFFIND
jgi:hypothetical protein